MIISLVYPKSKNVSASAVSCSVTTKSVSPSQMISKRVIVGCNNRDKLELPNHLGLMMKSTFTNNVFPESVNNVHIGES